MIGHGLRTGCAGYLVSDARVRYRESCPPRQSLRGNGYGEPGAESPLGLKFRRGPALGGAFVVTGSSVRQLFRCGHLPEFSPHGRSSSHRQRQTLLRGTQFADQFGVAHVLADDVGQQIRAMNTKVLDVLRDLLGNGGWRFDRNVLS